MVCRGQSEVLEYTRNRIWYFIFLNFYTFFATLTPKTSGYMFSSTLSSNMKLFLVSDAPNNRNFVAKFENVENLSVALIRQLLYIVQRIMCGYDANSVPQYFFTTRINSSLATITAPIRRLLYIVQQLLCGYDANSLPQYFFTTLGKCFNTIRIFSRISCPKRQDMYFRAR